MTQLCKDSFETLAKYCQKIPLGISLGLPFDRISIFYFCFFITEKLIWYFLALHKSQTNVIIKILSTGGCKRIVQQYFAKVSDTSGQNRLTENPAKAIFT